MTVDDSPEDATFRSTGARVGITALNLLQPGLGLVRLGAGSLGGLMIAAPLIFMLAAIALFAFAPTPSFAAIAIFVITVLAMLLALYVAAIILTWRYSARARTALPWWGRWYGLVAILAVVGVAENIAVEVAHRFYKPFYIPSESMAPTLGIQDRIIGEMGAVRAPALGDIVLIRTDSDKVLIRTASDIYVKRVVALPGDRIAIAADIPIVNGVRAQVRDAGVIRFLGVNGYQQARRFREQLPGEMGAHDIAIVQQSPYGDMAERTVPSGHVFVLGDNRERSIDSRLSLAKYGLGMVPISDLIGRPLYITWPHDSGRIGRPVNR